MTPETQIALIQSIAALPPTALLVSAIVGIMRGDVITRAHHEEIVEEKDERIAYLERKLERIKNGVVDKT